MSSIPGHRQTTRGHELRCGECEWTRPITGSTGGSAGVRAVAEVIGGSSPAMFLCRHTLAEHGRAPTQLERTPVRAEPAAVPIGPPCRHRLKPCACDVMASVMLR